jgi:hypothetical protein
LAPYLQIIDSKGSHFNVSKYHHLALEDGTYGFAGNTLNQKLFRSNETINKMNNVMKRGLYAPYSDAGNYYVVKSNGDKILAHVFSNIKNP